MQPDHMRDHESARSNQAIESGRDEPWKSIEDLDAILDKISKSFLPTIILTSFGTGDEDDLLRKI